MATSPPKSRPTRAKIEAIGLRPGASIISFTGGLRRFLAAKADYPGPLSARRLRRARSPKNLAHPTTRRGITLASGWIVDAASLGFMLFWTRSGVEGEDHLESVVWAGRPSLP